MNIIMLDYNIRNSARSLDDIHLKSQINEVCRILNLIYNYQNVKNSKIDIFDPLIQIHLNEKSRYELISYLKEMITEYKFRFETVNIMGFWFIGYCHTNGINLKNIVLPEKFNDTKTTICGNLTNNVDIICTYFVNNMEPSKGFSWTKREKPKWWDEYYQKEK